VKHVRTAAAVVALALAGCGGPLILRFEGSDIVNPNRRLNPPENLPVDVRVFLLKDNGTFEKANFEELWKDKYKAVLGADLVGEPRSITINAKDKKTLNLGEIPKEVRFIGLMAMYQEKAEGPPQKRHLAVAKDDADDFVYQLIEYRIEVKK
jgi:type VI secretion system VasD/TssJ family lipoprotein